MRPRRPLLLCAAALAAARLAPAAPIYAGPADDTTNGSGPRALSLSAGGRAHISEAGIATATISRRVTVDGSLTELHRAATWGANLPAALLPVPSGEFQTTTTQVTAVAPDGTRLGTAYSYLGSGTTIRPIRWAPDGTSTVLPAPSHTSFDITPVAINASGTIIGNARRNISGLPDQRPLRWAPNGAVTELPTYGTDAAGRTETTLLALNDAGIIVGTSAHYEGNTLKGLRATRWNLDGSLTELPSLSTNSSGVSTSLATHINNAGTIVGTSTALDPATNAFRGFRAVRWDPAGNLTELQHLGTTTNGTTYSYANDLNGAGLVVGEVERNAGSASIGVSAVYWDAAGDVHVLPFLSNNADQNANARALSLNNHGFITGNADLYEGNVNRGRRAVVWRPDLSIANLNDLVPANSGWIALEEAHTISESGWIAGRGLFDPDGPQGSRSPYPRHFSLRFHPAPFTSGPAGPQLGAVAHAAALTPAEQAHATLHTPSPLIALDLTGPGNIAQAIADLTWVSGGAYTVLTAGPQLDALRALHNVPYDALIQFPSPAAAFSWDFAGLDITVSALATYTLPGDYNADLVVDAADYTAWADAFGQQGINLPADGNLDGVIDAADYTVWADGFGKSLPGPASPISIPEPTAAITPLVLTAATLRRRRPVSP